MTEVIDFARNAERVLVGYIVLYVTTEAPQIIDGGVDSLTWKDAAIVIAFVLLGALTRAGVWSTNSVHELLSSADAAVEETPPAQ